MALSSPFENVHARMGARFAEYDEWRLPADFGDPAAERAALSNGAAAFDLSSFGRIALKGGGSGNIMASFMKGTPPPDEHCYRVDISDIAPLRVGCVKGGYLVLTPPWLREDVLERIRALAASESGDISIADMTEKTAMLGVYGARAFAAVTGILPFDLSGLEPGRIRVMSLFMIGITVLRGAWIEGDGLELICPASAAGMAAGALATYQQRRNIVPAGMDCLLSAMNRA